MASSLKSATLFVAVWSIGILNGQSTEFANPFYNPFCDRPATKTILSLCYKPAIGKTANVFGTDLYSTAPKGEVVSPQNIPPSAFFTIIPSGYSMINVTCETGLAYPTIMFTSGQLGSDNVRFNYGPKSDGTGTIFTAIVKKSASIVYSGALNPNIKIRCWWAKVDWLRFPTLTKSSDEMNAISASVKGSPLPA